LKYSQKRIDWIGVSLTGRYSLSGMYFVILPLTKIPTKSDPQTAHLQIARTCTQLKFAKELFFALPPIARTDKRETWIVRNMNFNNINI
jgi:hypothetical protein